MLHCAPQTCAESRNIAIVKFINRTFIIEVSSAFSMAVNNTNNKLKPISRLTKIRLRLAYSQTKLAVHPVSQPLYFRVGIKYTNKTDEASYSRSIQISPPKTNRRTIVVFPRVFFLLFFRSNEYLFKCFAIRRCASEALKCNRLLCIQHKHR